MNLRPAPRMAGLAAWWPSFSDWHDSRQSEPGAIGPKVLPVDSASNAPRQRLMCGSQAGTIARAVTEAHGVTMEGIRAGRVDRAGGPSYSLARRAVIRALEETGRYSNAEIARFMSCHVETVMRALK